MRGRRTHEKKLTDCKTGGDVLATNLISADQKNYRREMMFLSGGFLWRQGQRIKDLGERMARARIFGFHTLCWCCGPVISLGYRIQDLARNMPIGLMY
jgi:hypothetical protein